MNENQDAPLTPPIPPEDLCEQLATAAKVWDEKADEKALDGDVTNHALYQATAEGMRQAIHAVEDNPESIMEHPGWVKTD